MPGFRAGCFFISDEILMTNGILAVVTLGLVCACCGPKPDAVWQGTCTSSDNVITEQIDTIWCAQASNFYTVDPTSGLVRQPSEGNVRLNSQNLPKP